MRTDVKQYGRVSDDPNGQPGRPDPCRALMTPSFAKQIQLNLFGLRSLHRYTKGNVIVASSDESTLQGRLRLLLSVRGMTVINMTRTVTTSAGIRVSVRRGKSKAVLVQSPTASGWSTRTLRRASSMLDFELRSSEMSLLSALRSVVDPWSVHGYGVRGRRPGRQLRQTGACDPSTGVCSAVNRRGRRLTGRRSTSLSRGGPLRVRGRGRGAAPFGLPCSIHLRADGRRTIRTF